MKLLTLCIVHQAPMVLLGKLKYGLAQDKWVGFGGEILPGETLEQAVVRKTYEEAGIMVCDIMKVGMTWISGRFVSEIFETHIFCAHRFTGTVVESEDVRPQSFDVAHLPLENMWPADRLWLPLVLEGKRFRAAFLCNFGQVLEHRITEVDEV